MKQIYNTYFGIIILVILACSSCETPSSEKMQLPIEVSYAIQSQDTGARAMVHAYFGERMSYVLHDSSHFTMRRSALTGDVTQWYDGDNLWIREESGEYCTCVHLEGEILELWKRDEYLVSAEFEKEPTRSILNEPVRNGLAFNDGGDSTWVSCAVNFPNAWFDHTLFPGLPMEYIYNLRGAKVVYLADSLKSSEEPFTPAFYQKSCVATPAEAYLGFSPLDTIQWTSDKIWVYGDMLNSDNEYVRGELLIQTFDKGVESRSRLRIDEGIFDIELVPGKSYVLDFWAPGFAHNRIQLDCSNMPFDGSNIMLDLSNNLIEPQNQAVDDYLQNTLMGIAVYDPREQTLVFDFEYTEAVGAEVQRLSESN